MSSHVATMSSILPYTLLLLVTYTQCCLPGSTLGDNVRQRWWNGVMNGRVPSVNLQNSGFWSNQSIHEMESGVVVINKGNR